jgi:hypothetical protein
MSRLNFPSAKLSFEPPAGFRPLRVPGFLWCGRSATGERVTVQLWKRNTGLTRLAASSSALVYTHLHKKNPGKTFLRTPAEGLQVGGADASFSGIERREYGKPVRSYQILTLFAGNLYLFEYAAPAELAEKNVKVFSKLLDSVRWTGMPAEQKTLPLDSSPPQAPSQAELSAAQKLGIPYLPKSRATATKAGGILGAGM